MEVIHVEEPDAGDADDCPFQIIKPIRGLFDDKRIEHAPRGGEPVTIRRCRILARIEMIGLDDHMITRSRRVRQYDVDIAVALTFDASNLVFDPVHV